MAEVKITTKPVSTEYDYVYGEKDGAVKRIPKSSMGAEIDPTLSHTGEAADAKATGDALAEKVDKVAGKELSTNDFDDNEKAQTDFVRTHFYEGQTSLVFSEDNLENIYITAQENIVLEPAGSDYGSVYKGRIEEENELMTRVDVDVAINAAIGIAIGGSY